MMRFGKANALVQCMLVIFVKMLNSDHLYLGCFFFSPLAPIHLSVLLRDNEFCIFFKCIYCLCLAATLEEVNLMDIFL